MFVDTEARPAGEPAKVGTLKLSEAIRKGKPLVGMEAADFRLCALGCAWAGVKGVRMTSDDYVRLLGKYPRAGHFGNAIMMELGFPKELGARVSYMHSSGVPALKIADRMESEGF